MKANSILKTLFNCSVQERILGSHSFKSTVQRVYLEGSGCGSVGRAVASDAIDY